MIRRWEQGKMQRGLYGGAIFAGALIACLLGFGPSANAASPKPALRQKYDPRPYWWSTATPAN
jgi:hypothetical protein